MVATEFSIRFRIKHEMGVPDGQEPAERNCTKVMVARGKGILAADESHPTCGKRFEALGIENTSENRRIYRQMFFNSPDVEKYISGVILFDETLRQSDDAGVPFPENLNAKGIVPGIKVDTDIKDLAGFPGEKVTEGLDGSQGSTRRIL